MSCDWLVLSVRYCFGSSTVARPMDSIESDTFLKIIET
jgi:hypothetical protein